MLTGMLLLMFRFGVSYEELVDRCRRDMGWKYAIGLPYDKEPPSVSSVKRHQSKVRKHLGDEFLHQRMLQLAVEDGKLTDASLQAVDSTPTNCRGAVIDTFNLIAAGIGQVVRSVARCLGERAEILARRWGMSRYLERSIKGNANIDWNDPEARNALLTEEIRDADSVAELVEGLNLTLPSNVEDSVALLRKVARQDVEETEDGNFRIAEGTVPGRIISITDPEASHGRKSSSKVINGFKTHVLGTVESQFVTGIDITSAGTHDAEPTTELLKQADKVDLLPDEVLGDCAYGTGANRRACAEMDVEIHAKLPAPNRKGCYPKPDFTIDLEAMRVTCPKGESTENHTMVKDPSGSNEKVARFYFDKACCGACPNREACSSRTAKGQGRTITLSVYEEESQEAKAFQGTERGKSLLRSRSAVERLISHLVRMGMRHARFFGLHAVQFQAFMTATVYNLQRYINLTAKARPPAAAAA